MGRGGSADQILYGGGISISRHQDEAAETAEPRYYIIPNSAEIVSVPLTEKLIADFRRDENGNPTSDRSRPWSSARIADKLERRLRRGQERIRCHIFGFVDEHLVEHDGEQHYALSDDPNSVIQLRHGDFGGAVLEFRGAEIAAETVAATDIVIV